MVLERVMGSFHYCKLALDIGVVLDVYGHGPIIINHRSSIIDHHRDGCWMIGSRSEKPISRQSANSLWIGRMPDFFYVTHLPTEATRVRYSSIIF
jgi:hypothetical protein